jgi:murein DD-endopeptidase MepM/ murein hydrolase activator NlpD
MKIVLVVVLIAIFGIIGLSFFSVAPSISVPGQVNAIGQATPVTLQISAPHGIRHAAAFVEQNGARYTVWQKDEPARRVKWNRNVPATTATFTVGANSTPQLKDGKAQVIVEATSNDFRAKTSRVAWEVTVVTRPPQVAVDSDQHYLYLGMADLVTFNVAGYYNDAGVAVAGRTFRGWPMPGGKPGQFSIFAIPWDAPAGAAPEVYASAPAGNRATGTMAVSYPKKEQPKYRTRDLQLDDKFLQKVTAELDPSGSGDMVARFLKINSEMRRANNKTLSDLRLETEPRFLWSQPFQQQPNSKVESNFADVRNYFYQGKKIDQQVHLGYDLSITQHVGVQASNDGKVVWAGPLGIYGNCIVLDHGYALQTIYGHLSEIAVHKGDMVKRGQVMGKSGMTGLAGGDHIHFSMQLDGVQIDPKEWWDAHWIKDHISKRVELAAPTS